jgi:hypothetical protein
MMEMGIRVRMVVSVPLFFVHTLELGHKSSYFQSTSRLDLCPLPVSASFIQQKVSQTPNDKGCLIFVSVTVSFKFLMQALKLNSTNTAWMYSILQWSEKI